MLHRFLLGQFGMGIGELWALDTLAARCAELGRHEFFLTSAPLQTVAGVGSPANALAIL
jgi:kynurenine formamidase